MSASYVMSTTDDGATTTVVSRTISGAMAAAIASLGPGGRLVANAVTTDMEAVLLDHHARLGGTLIRIDIARAGPVGAMTGWRPAMPVTQWSWIKS